MRFPILTVVLIAINVAVFAWQLTLLRPSRAARPQARAASAERPEHARVRRDPLPAHPPRQGLRGRRRSPSSREPSVVCQGVCESTPRHRTAESQPDLPTLDSAAVVGDRVHLDVHARRHPPHRLQHAVPVDLRQQHRGLDGPAAVRALLPAGGDRRRLRAGAARPGLHRAGDRGQRRGRRRTGRLPAALSPRPRADTDLHHLLRHPDRDPGGDHARDLVRAPVPPAIGQVATPGRRRGAAASPTSPTSAASSSGWRRSSCSRTAAGADRPGPRYPVY